MTFDNVSNYNVVPQCDIDGNEICWIKGMGYHNTYKIEILTYPIFESSSCNGLHMCLQCKKSRI